MSDSPKRTSCETIHALLEPARSTLLQMTRRRAWVEAGRFLWKVGVLVVVAALVLFAVSRWRQIAIPGYCVGILVAIAGYCLLFALIRASRFVRRHRPTWRETAERLDLAHDSYNRVATSLDLSGQEPRSPFAQAAIEEGIDRLKEVAHLELPEPEFVPYRNGMQFGGISAVCLIVVGLYCVIGLQGTPLPHPGSVEGISNGVNPVVIVAQREDEQTKSSLRKRREDSVRKDVTDRKNDVAGSTPDAGAGNKADGRNDAGARSGRETGTQSNAAASASSSSASSSGKPGLEAKPAKKRSSARKPRSASAMPEQGEMDQSNASLSGGGGGAGRFLPVAGHGEQKATPPAEDHDAMDDPGELESTDSTSDHRGGIQPSLPDRTAAPSRELGITGPKSKRPGTGRGGPSPLKKSRGTASLLMGVPMPDFVRGKIGPGPVAITVETTHPQAQPGASSETAEAERRVMAETIIPQACISWSDAEAVRLYLAAWHGRDLQTIDILEESTITEESGTNP